MSARSALSNQFSRYTVVSAHMKAGAKRHTVTRKGFDRSEDASEYGESLDPMKDGHMLPNLPDSVIRSHEKAGLMYNQGHYFAKVNRHSVTFLDPKQGSKYRGEE